MKRILFIITMLACFFSNAKTFYIDKDLSSVSFTTTKNKFVIESASISEITGYLKKDKFEAIIDFTKVQTGIIIRDERINDLYLTKLFPTAMVKGTFNLKSLSRIGRVEIPATITLYGNSREMMLPVVIQKGIGYFSVNSTHSIIIKGSDFGIPSANLIALAATVGGIAISDTIPVNFNLVFKEK